MSAQTLERRAPHSDLAAAWAVELLRRPGSRADIRRAGDRMHVWLGDDNHVDGGACPGRRAPPDTISGGAGGCADLVLHTDGRVLVTCCAAPPALVVARERSHLLPDVPATSGTEQLSDGDLVVMCSASALDHLPAGIGAVLAWAPLKHAARRPDDLLDRLLTDTDVGSAVLARYRAPHPDTESLEHTPTMPSPGTRPLQEVWRTDDPKSGIPAGGVCADGHRAPRPSGGVG